MPPLLSINNFSLQFNSTDASRATEVLHEVFLEINQGETHALVGESGSGKSITALSILRLLEEVSNVSSSGSIIYDGRRIEEMDKEGIRSIRGNEIAMIFQEPMTSLNPVYTIGNQLIEPLMVHRNMSKQEAYERALVLLERTGIADPEYRFTSYPHQLSGGQRQRVMIAMALACSPKLLIADEPTTALDITIQEQILDLIEGIQQEYSMAVLLITHDLPMVKKRADRVSIMHNGRIVEQGKSEQLFQNPVNPYTINLLNSIPRGSREKREPTEPLLTVNDLTCSFTLQTKWEGLFKRKKTLINAVDALSIEVEKNKTLGVVGESGSGKSTLAMCILGLYKFKGDISYHAKEGKVELSSLSAHRFRPYRKNLQIIFQDPYSSLSPRLTIEQIIGEGLLVHGIGTSGEERQQMIIDALRDVELEPDIANRFPHEFSGGQRQRIAIARSLILRPDLLILDEPTSALDMTIQKQILELLAALQERYGLTYIFITHDLRTIRTIADNLIVMQHGKIVESGQAQTVFSNPVNPYTQRLFSAAFQ